MNNKFTFIFVLIVMAVIIPAIMLYHGWALMVSWNLLAGDSYQLSFAEATGVAVVSGILVGTKTVGLAKSRNYLWEGLTGGLLGPLAVIYGAWIISSFFL